MAARQRSARDPAVARLLVGCWSEEPWTRVGLFGGALRLFGRQQPTKTLSRLIDQIWTDHARRPPIAELVEAVVGHRDYPYLCRMKRAVVVIPPRPRMSDPPGDWPVPRLDTPTELAAWLRLTPAELDWLASPRNDGGHYRYRWHGERLIEAPLPWLRDAQRKLSRGVLQVIPPHDAAHGFVPGRGVLSAVTPHVRPPVLVAMDLRAFFPSVHAARAHAIFRTTGYPIGVTRSLTGLVTTAVPEAALRAGPPLPWRVRQHYRFAHLPQGAPTSPAVANLAAYRLDCRLSGAACSFGGVYTRYADDLLFSGDGVADPRFADLVAQIAADEGFRLHAAKTRVMRPHQRQEALGVVLNDRPKPARRALERLEATLFNCVRDGPAAQDRDGLGPRLRDHLTGRVAWVRQLDPRAAAPLQALLAQIDWSQLGEPELPV